MNNNACCFTGHRDLPCDTGVLQSKLESLLVSLAEQGYTQFIAGGAIGFDMLAAQSVLKLKRSFPNIQLHLILPCSEQDKYWSYDKKSEYRDILGKADSTELICESYTRYCMAQRNRAMVDRSSLVIAYFNGIDKGGTAMTVKYAEKKGIKTINLY